MYNGGMYMRLEDTHDTVSNLVDVVLFMNSSLLYMMMAFSVLFSLCLKLSSDSVPFTELTR